MFLSFLSTLLGFTRQTLGATYVRLQLVGDHSPLPITLPSAVSELFSGISSMSLHPGHTPELTFHQQLMSFQLSYRTTPHSTTPVTPASLFLKRDLNLDLLHPAMDQTVAISQAQRKQQHDQHAQPRDLFVGQRVLVCNFRPGPTWVPGTIIKCNGPLSYQVKVSDDRIWNRHMNHLLESVDTRQTFSISDSPSEVLSHPNSSESVQTDEVSSRRSESEPVEITGQPESTPLSTSSTASSSLIHIQTLP